MDEKANASRTVGFLLGIILIFAVADLFGGVRGKTDAGELIGKEHWVEIKTWVDIIFGKKEINGIYLGEDDYLFTHYSDRKSAESSQSVVIDASDEAVQEKLALLKGLVSRYDAAVMLVPTADNILVEKLPAGAEYYNQRPLLEQAEEAVGTGHFVNVYDTLRAHREEYIYYRTDTHWTSLGAYYAYREWNRTKGGTALVTFDTENMETASEDFRGNLQGGIIRKRQADTISVFSESRKRVPTVTYDTDKQTFVYYAKKHLTGQNPYDYFLDGEHAYVEISTGYKRGRELVLLKDSYANCMIPLLANHYDRIHVVDLALYTDSLEELILPHMGETTDVLVVYNCVNFIQNFMYY